MTPRITTVLVFLVALLSPRAAFADLEVVATVPTLAALAKEIGGEHASVVSLALPTQDPHFVDAKPSLALKLRDADLLLAVGLSLEVGWLPNLQSGSRNASIQNGAQGYLECASYVGVLDVRETVDRSKGDIHPGGNPHYLYDPRQIAQCAAAIAGRMGELDGDNADSYKSNLKKLLKRLHFRRKKLEKRLADHRGTPIVTYHRSWVYLSDWLGLKEVAYLEPKPGIPPSPAHVAEVLAAARKNGVKIVLQENFYPNDTGGLVAEKAGASLVVVPAAVDFDGGETVAKWLDRLVGAIAKGMGA
jgi:zinc/manganese transport system substrate-binding protein